MNHLDELALEAIAHGRNDLVPDEDRLHLASCDACGARLDALRAESKELVSLFAREAAAVKMPLPDLESMIATAIAKAPAPEPALARPGMALVFGALGVGVAATATLAFLSLPSLGSVVSFVRDGLAVVSAFGRVLEVVPGGFSAVALAGALVLLALALPLRRLVGGRPLRLDAVATIFVAALAAAAAVAPQGFVRALDFEGEWPARENTISITADHEAVSDVLLRAAEASHLGYVSTLPADAREVTLRVQNGSLRDVLEAILGPDAPVVARRTASMLVLSPATAATNANGNPNANANANGTSGNPAVPSSENTPDESPTLAVPTTPATPATPTAPPTPPRDPSEARALDGPISNVETFGDDIRIRAGERVRDVTTMGGDVVVEGEVLGNVTTMGGDIEVREGGVVHGELVTMGGDVDIREGGAAYGQMVTMGGDVDVHEGAIAKGGRVRMRFGDRHRDGADGDDGDGDEDGDVHAGARGGFIGWLEDAVGSLAKHALLFVLGVLLMVLAPTRFAAVRRRITAAPVRLVVTGLLGFVGTAVLTVVLVITLVGIPAALVVAVGAFLALYVGLTASAWVLGGALPFPALRDKPVLQLGAGLCALFVASLVPVLGGVVAFFATAVGFGAVLFTRFRPDA